ncbi:response regulator [Rhodococcus ruber]|uniref:response regulator n=1 Tax=Rhodococcus ruber TaxID=1830 RepID=UPI0013762545|nr:response regulator transcription factor [Rhodococcus ruber]
MTAGGSSYSGTDRTYWVFVVDGHDVTRRGLAGFIDDHPRLCVAGEAASLAEARARLPKARPHIAVLDTDLPDGTGAELCRTLTAADPRLRCVLWSLTADPHQRQAARAAGACGWVGKGLDGQALTAA